MISHRIKVTNKGDVPFEDRYDGVLYSFAAGKSVNLPADAAAHIFGVHFEVTPNGTIDPKIRDVIFLHLQKRWGWNRAGRKEDGRESIREKGKQLFDTLHFSVVNMVTKEQTVAEEENLAEPREPHQVEERPEITEVRSPANRKGAFKNAKAPHFNEQVA